MTLILLQGHQKADRFVSTAGRIRDPFHRVKCEQNSRAENQDVAAALL